MRVKDRLIELFISFFDIDEDGCYFISEERKDDIAPEFADYFINHGVTFADDNNVGDKWVPVSERLPGDGQDILLYDSVFDVTDLGTYYGKGKVLGAHWIVNGKSCPISDYTHWMPISLPELPKEGEA